MRLPRAKFTLAWLMALVAVLGIALSLTIPLLRRAEVERLRTEYRRQVRLNMDRRNDYRKDSLDAKILLDQERIRAGRTTRRMSCSYRSESAGQTRKRGSMRRRRPDSVG